MDGLTATRRIREDYPEESQPYIIAMTAGVLESDRERCIESGMDEHLAKPVQLAGLRQVLDAFEARLQGDLRPMLQQFPDTRTPVVG
jgi:CheY-like chemotaxis protein